MSHSAPFSLTTVAKKFIIALSGLGLLVYTILHLLGNLTLYGKNGGLFNVYAAQLQHLGGFLVFLELALLFTFISHAFAGLTTKLKNKQARPVSYRVWKSKGGGTPSNLSSRTMYLSGLVLLVFTIVHVLQFRFGPAIEEGYKVIDKGEEIRDLYRLVVEVLKNPFMSAFYMVAMIILGVHLKHAIWSSLQTLGLVNARTTRPLRFAGAALGILLAVGFLFIPIWIYFGV